MLDGQFVTVPFQHTDDRFQILLNIDLEHDLADLFPVLIPDPSKDVELALLCVYLEQVYPFYILFFDDSGESCKLHGKGSS